MASIRRTAAAGRARGAARRRKATARRLPGSVLGRHANVLILGTGEPAGKLQKELVVTGVPVRRTTSPRDTDEVADATTRALFIVPPIADVSVARYCNEFTRHHQGVPVFVVMPGTLAERSIRELYRRGARAVFEWPADRDALLRTAFRVAGIHGGGPSDGRSNVGLEELVNARLRTAPTEFGRALLARVQRRYVTLTGRVDSLWKLQVAEQIALEVPGVDDVVAEGVEVTESQSAGAMSKAIRQVLKHASNVDTSTLAIRVDDGNVVLAGTAEDRGELDRAISLIKHVRGVRSLDNYATVSPAGKQQDRQVAKRAQRAVAAHYPQSKVDVSVFGGVAVLAGVAKSAGQRRDLERLVAGQLGVDRVVDKLRVQTSAAS